MPFVVAGIAGLVTLVAGVWFWSRYWVVKDTPTSKCAAVFVGRNEVVFQDLAARITEQENQVAYARGFYNDAVTVLRDRRQAFPGNLLARYVTTPSWHLFDAHDHETYVPPVTPLPSG